MTQGVFAKKIISSRADHVYIVQGKHAKRDYWCVVMVDRLKLDAFKKKLGGAMRVQDYGNVLRWGYGEPPDDIEREFGSAGKS